MLNAGSSRYKTGMAAATVGRVITDIRNAVDEAALPSGTRPLVATLSDRQSKPSLNTHSRDMAMPRFFGISGPLTDASAFLWVLSVKYSDTLGHAPCNTSAATDSG